VKYQLEHVEWTGCSAWDLIQPSFMFIVGVSLPFSLASRRQRGESEAAIGWHAAWRAALLVAIGIFLRSNGKSQTNFTFEDVSTQIGLGYLFLFLIVGRPIVVQLATVSAILLGYWGLFAGWPLATSVPAGIPDDWKQFEGFAGHWNKHLNPAGEFDRWFLNLFPRAEPFVFNKGGYQTLNFIPATGTMMFGVMTGELLRRPWGLLAKIGVMLLASAVCFGVGMAVDRNIWPVEGYEVCVAPVVKKIWTPSWTVFSTGWTLATLAGFVLVMDVWRLRAWAFPFVVVGMNSIAMYVMSWLTKPWLQKTLHTHLGDKMFEGVWGPVVEMSVVVFLLWFITWWMYRQRIFIRI
jgi:predicted acyltransferase